MVADSYREATAWGLIRFDSSGPADSNGPLPNSIRWLVLELFSGLYFCSPGRYIQIVSCRVVQARHSFEPYTIGLSSPGGFKWSASQLDLTAGCGATFWFVLLFARQVQPDCFLQNATSCHSFEPYTIEFLSPS